MRAWSGNEHSLVSIDIRRKRTIRWRGHHADHCPLNGIPILYKESLDFIAYLLIGITADSLKKDFSLWKFL